MNGFFNSLKNLASGAAYATGSTSRDEELEGDGTTSLHPSRMLLIFFYVYARRIISSVCFSTPAYHAHTHIAVYVAQMKFC